MYLKNSWYMAAWSDELNSGQVTARTLLDIPVALFRRADGSPAAVLDRCPHKFAPLSAGRLDGDTIFCGYHGLGFNGSGACVVNPHGPVLRSIAVQSYPVHEVHRGVWIWMGDADLADPALIPDFSFLASAPDSAFSCGYTRSSGNYEVFVDNLMDLSHTEYLHPTTLGGGAISGIKPKVDAYDKYVDVTWVSQNTPAPPLFVKLLGEAANTADRFTRVRWFPASVMRLTVQMIPKGKSEAEGISSDNAHFLTPETATTSHYFFAATRNFKVDDAELNNMIATTRANIFLTEDKPMIELVQNRMGDADFWSLKPILLPIDAGPVTVRRKLRALIEEEGPKASSNLPLASSIETIHGE